MYTYTIVSRHIYVPTIGLPKDPKVIAIIIIGIASYYNYNR